MARIPVVQEPSVRTEGLPTAYARPFATPQGQGADFGNVLEGAARVASDYVQEARQKGDAASIQGAWGQAQDALNKTILDPEKGYSSLRGSDAMAGREKALGTYNKALDGINERLTPDQQRMFEPHLRAIREQGYTHVISHEAREQEIYAQGNFKGNVDSTMETMQQPTIVASPDDLKLQVGKLFQAGIDEGKRRYGTDASKEAIRSVVDPMLQQAALGGMQAALTQAEQAGDPKIASDAFDVLGKYLLKNHQKQIGGMVEALTAKAAIRQQTSTLLRGATDSVPTPDGPPVARVNAMTLDRSMANLSPDTKYLPEIQKAVETRQGLLNRAWTSTVGTVFDRAEGAALKGGGFDLERASAVDIEWLRVNAPAQLLKLQQEDQKGTRAQSTKESHDAYSAMALDMDARKDVYRDLSVPEVGQIAVDRGLNATDRDKIRKLHDAIQKGGLSEAINSTVAKELLRALPNEGDKETRETLQGDLLDAAKDFADRWSKETKGQVVPTVKLREFVRSELVRGKVQDTGIGGFFNDEVTRLEYQNAAKYRGKTFEPSDPTVSAIPQVPTSGGPPVTAATPVAPAAPAPAPTGQGTTPEAVPDQAPATVKMTAAAPQYWRYTKDRSKRYPTDEKGNIIGPAEVAK